MARFSWADRINGHVGSLVDQVLIYAGVGTALALFVFDFPMWLVAVAGLVIAFGVPLALHFFAALNMIPTSPLPLSSLGMRGVLCRRTPNLPEA